MSGARSLQQYGFLSQSHQDGSEIPAWLSRPFAELATKGRIGFQGKHAGAPIYFRNIRIRDAK